MKVLFIEGPHEGQVRDVHYGAHYWTIANPSWKSAVMRYAPGTLLENLPVLSTDYRVHPVHLRCTGMEDATTFVGMLPNNMRDPSMEFVRYSIQRLNPS